MKVFSKAVGPETGVRSYKQYYTRDTKWGRVVQAWPRKYNSKFKWWLIYKRAEFAYAAMWAANAEPMSYETAVNHSKGTDYLPRDVLVACMYARWYQIQNPDGFIWPRVRDMAQNPQLILDLITQEVGAVLYRSENGWVWVPPGNDGQVLSIFSQTPQWQDVYPIAIANNDFLVKTADPTLLNARVVKDGTTVLASWGTPGEVTLKRAALTGDVTAALDDNATTIANGAVTYAKIQNVSNNARVLGRKTSGAGVVEELTSGDLSGMIGAGGGGVLQVPYFNNANIYLTPFAMSSTSVTTHNCVANNIRFVPIVVPWARTFTSIAINIPTGGSVAGSNARLGIFDLDTATGGPGNVVLDAGNVTTASLGPRAITINQALNPGTYFLAMWTSTTIIVRGWNASSSANIIGCDMLSASVTPQNFLTRNATFGSAFSSESSQTHALTAGTTSTPIIGIR